MFWCFGGLWYFLVRVVLVLNRKDQPRACWGVGLLAWLLFLFVFIVPLARLTIVHLRFFLFVVKTRKWRPLHPQRK